jgi:hypothetical protein
MHYQQPRPKRRGNHIARTPSARRAILCRAPPRFCLVGRPSGLCRNTIGVQSRSCSPRVSSAQARLFRRGRGRGSIAPILASSKAAMSWRAAPISRVPSAMKTLYGWRKHGHDDNVCATLAWASCNESSENGDRAGCSRALLEHGMSGATLGPDNPKRVLIASRRGRFTDVLLQMRDLP